MIGVTRRPREPCPKNFLAYLVVLCFERRCLKQNTVARLKSKIFAPPKFWAGYTTEPGPDFPCRLRGYGLERQNFQSIPRLLLLAFHLKIPSIKVNPAQVTSAQFGQAVLLLKLKNSQRSRRKLVLPVAAFS